MMFLGRKQAAATGPGLPDMGCVKQKSAFKHVQNVPIQIILRMHKVSSRAQLFKASLA